MVFIKILCSTAVVKMSEFSNNGQFTIVNIIQDQSKVVTDNFIRFSILFLEAATAAESFSHVQLFATPWTTAHQAILSMGFPRQEYWSGLPFPSPEDLPNLGIETAS